MPFLDPEVLEKRKMIEVEKREIEEREKDKRRQGGSGT